jgi:hypothetical protein
MIRPVRPGLNVETASSNDFQQEIPEADEIEIRTRIIAEFNKMVDLLESHDIDVKVFDDSDVPVKPDAHFPNNWISTHPEGRVVVYPMLAESRSRERRQDIVEWLNTNYQVDEIIDLSILESRKKYLEGTGSLVVDYTNSIAYAGRSPRTDEELVIDVCKKLDYRPVIFDAVAQRGTPIYHTNVLMCVGSKFATLCLDSIKDANQQEEILGSLSDTGHKVVAISYDQMHAFAGNMIELTTRSGEPIVVLSDRAFNILLPGQVDAISRHAEMLPISIPTIEDVGGGSVRCMIAANYLSKRTN